MAWRLDEAIEHGIIDNTVEGTTTGKIWLAGRDEPLILSLNGDCWRDLAGTRLEFENPDPRVSEEANNLDTEQTGMVGDITAALKVQVSEVPDYGHSGSHFETSEIPTHWQNILYLEWFSEINGRVLVEAAGYQMEVSDRAWVMDEDLEEAQKLANMSSMRDFMAQVIRRIEPIDPRKKSKARNARGELDEFEWEERLKESDRLTDAYQEVLEKYMDDPDAEQKEAFAMGWDGLLSAMAHRDEGGIDDDEDDEAQDWQLADDEFYDDENDDDQVTGEAHPLQRLAHDIALRSFDIVNTAIEREYEGPEQRFTSLLIQVSTKLAGVLNDRATGYEPEAGFVLAVLKRCLNWINDAVGACNEIIESEEDADQIAALEHLRTDIFRIRDGIIEIRRTLKQS